MQFKKTKRGHIVDVFEIKVFCLSRVVFLNLFSSTFAFDIFIFLVILFDLSLSCVSHVHIVKCVHILSPYTPCFVPVKYPLTTRTHRPQKIFYQSQGYYVTYFHKCSALQYHYVKNIIHYKLLNIYTYVQHLLNRAIPLQ